MAPAAITNIHLMTYNDTGHMSRRLEGSALTTGSEISGTMLHWILQPLEKEHESMSSAFIQQVTFGQTHQSKTFLYVCATHCRL